MEKRAKQQQAEAALTRTDRRRGEDTHLVGNLIGKGHANYVLVYNILPGFVLACVSRCQAKIKRPLTEEINLWCLIDLLLSIFTGRHKFSFDIVGNELTSSAEYDFKFKDYASWVFRSLREEHFHLDPADYLLSLTSKYILSELGSPGKSGSFFYFSRDYRFIIKTIRHSEHKFLLSVLKQYSNHVKDNPHTLLSRFYGLHGVKLPRGRKIHFVIMNNLFPPHKDVHETFDLKGSTVGREYPEELAKEKNNPVLKDLNWIHRGHMLELGPGPGYPAWPPPTTADVKRDIAWQKWKLFPEAIAMRRAMRDSDLKRLGKGIRLPEEDTGDRQHFIFYQDEGGLRGTDENNDCQDTIYYLSVIDILTPYNVAKKVEHLWKGMKADRHKISPVQPDEWYSRMYTGNPLVHWSPRVEALPTLDGHGRLYDVGHGKDDKQVLPGNRQKKEKVETRDPKPGDLVRIKADDDSSTLGEMLRQEKFGAGMSDQKNWVHCAWFYA
ncbi:SAICAR synthase-like protein [Hymenopellis radicata]|nr:SAICAR synthase-like protein [Hymenopellis radicata]